MRISDERQFFEVKIDIGKIGIISCPAFCDRWNNRAQSLAALHSSRLLFLFRWFGMKRTRALRFGDGSCDCAKRTMIRNCQPRQMAITTVVDRPKFRCTVAVMLDFNSESFRSQSSTCRPRSNVFFCINDWPNGGRDCFRPHPFTRARRCRTGLAELRLLNPRCHQHRGEEQRGCEIIRCAR